MLSGKGTWKLPYIVQFNILDNKWTVQEINAQTLKTYYMCLSKGKE